jgi:hypothetical protein
VLGDISRLPFSMKVLLAILLRSPHRRDSRVYLGFRRVAGTDASKTGESG